MPQARGPRVGGHGAWSSGELCPHWRVEGSLSRERERLRSVAASEWDPFSRGLFWHGPAFTA